MLKLAFSNVRFKGPVPPTKFRESNENSIQIGKKLTGYASSIISIICIGLGMTGLMCTARMTRLEMLQLIWCTATVSLEVDKFSFDSGTHAWDVLHA